MRRGKLIAGESSILHDSFNSCNFSLSLSKQNYFFKDEFSFFRMFTSRQRFSYIGKINIFSYSRTSHPFTRYSCHHITSGTKGVKRKLKKKFWETLLNYMLLFLLDNMHSCTLFHVLFLASSYTHFSSAAAAPLRNTEVIAIK